MGKKSIPSRGEPPRGYGRNGLNALICIALAIGVWISFGGALACGFVEYDDPSYVYRNPHITNGLSFSAVRWAFTHSHSNNWHPLTTISHMFDCQFFGVQPWAHHLINVLLHALAAVFLFVALRNLTAARSTRTILQCAFVAAVFAVHPLRVESVVWISERKDVLSGIFFMLTLWAYAHYARTQARRYYWWCLGCYGLGLMSKPTLVTLPFVLLLLDYWPLQRFAAEWKGRQRSGWALVREKIPLFVLSALCCVATLIAQGEALAVGTREAQLPARLANAAITYATYLAQTFYPADPSVSYPYLHGKSQVVELVGALLLIGAITLASLLLRRRCPALVTGWLWYLGMLVPMIGLVQAGQQPHADRYTYLPTIGLSIMIVWGVVALLSRHRYIDLALGLAASVISIGLVACSFRETPHWRDTESLWRHAVENTSDNYVAHYNLANALSQKRATDAAMAEYRIAISIDPTYAPAYNNLCLSLADANRVDEAITNCEEALRLRPDFAATHNNLGLLFARTGRLHDAEFQFREAIRTSPSDTEARFNLVRVLEQLGEHEAAETERAEALRLKSKIASESP